MSTALTSRERFPVRSVVALATPTTPQTLTYRHTYDASAGRLWQAITEPRERAAWFIPDVEIPHHACGRIERGKPRITGVVSEWSPPTRLEVSWDNGSAFAFNLADQEERCAVTFSTSESGEPTYEPWLASCWHLFLDAMVLHLEGAQRYDVHCTAHFPSLGRAQERLRRASTGVARSPWAWQDISRTPYPLRR